MAIFTTVYINDVAVDDYYDLQISSTQSDYAATSSFTMVVDSPFGRHASDWTVGSDIKIRVGTGEEETMYINPVKIPTAYHEMGLTTYQAQTFTVGQFEQIPNEYFNLTELMLYLYPLEAVGQTYLSMYAVDGDGKPTGDALISGYLNIESSQSWFKTYQFNMDYSSNMILQYKMNDDLADTVIVDNVAGNNGTIYGGNTQDFSAAGIVNKSFNFPTANITDYIKLDDTLVNGLTDFTFSIWVKTSGDSKNRYFISCANSVNANEIALSVHASTDQLLNFSVAGSTSAFGISPAINDGEWHHVVALREGNIAKMYVDNIALSQVVFNSDALVVDTGGFILRQDQDSVGGGFNSAQAWLGSIDDFRVYNKALTPGEVSLLYNYGQGTEGSPLFELEPDTQYAMVLKSANSTDVDRLRLRAADDDRISGEQPWKSTDSGSSWSDATGDAGDWFFRAKGIFTRGRKIFRGRLEKVSFQGRGTSQFVTLSGRDYTGELLDVTVPPTLYNNSEVSTIVADLVNNNTPDIDTSLVITDTGVTLTRIVFSHDTLYDALIQLANRTSFNFYIDVEKRLIFRSLEDIEEAFGEPNVPILRMKFDTTRERMANSIWVYGDRSLSAIKEVNTLNGSSWGGSPGSIYTLLYKPHNTSIEISSKPGSILTGGIYEMNIIPTSGFDYLVSFHDRQIIFQSGTEIGYNTIPPSGGSIVSNYQRSVPIVKFGENRTNIELYGKKSKIINDKNIKDPSYAMKILKDELGDTDPLKRFDVEASGWISDYYDILNKRIELNVPEFGINNQKPIVIGVTYKFDKNSVLNEDIVTLHLDNKILDLTDEIRELKVKVENLEAEERQDTDVITRLEQATGSMIIVGSKWNLFTRTLGSSFILGKIPTTTGPTFGGRLGSMISSGINFLGDSRSAFSLATSGGYY